MNPLAAPIRAMLSFTLVILATLVPNTLAQVPQPSVSITIDEPSLELGAANTTTLPGTVSYADDVPGSTGNIDITVSAPAGWTIVVEPASFSLTDGQSADFTATLTAPAAGTGDAAADATFTATAAPDQAGRGATASATLSLTRIDPTVPPPPWYQTPAGIAGIIGAVLLAAGAAAAIAWNRRNKRIASEKAAREAAEHAAYLARETGIGISLQSGPIEYGHKREVMYRVTVTNTSDRPRVAIIDIADITNGWRAATQLTKIPLSIGETQPITLIVTPDAVITPGDRAIVTVRARPEEAREKDERLTIHVSAPKAGVPNDPNYRIVTVHREGIGIKPR